MRFAGPDDVTGAGRSICRLGPCTPGFHPARSHFIEKQVPLLWPSPPPQCQLLSPTFTEQIRGTLQPQILQDHTENSAWTTSASLAIFTKLNPLSSSPT
eukprot:bmy_02680T0